METYRDSMWLENTDQVESQVLCISPAMIYDSECWDIEAWNIHNINVQNTRMLRKMCGYMRAIVKIRNGEYIDKPIPPIEDKIRDENLDGFSMSCKDISTHKSNMILI